MAKMALVQAPFSDRTERFDTVALSAIFRCNAAPFLRAALTVEMVEQHLANALSV